MEWRRPGAICAVVGFIQLLSTAPVVAVTVSVVPPDTTVSVGTPCTLRIVTDAFPDLKGFQLIFSFDPTKLQFVGADPGDVLTSSGNPFSMFVVNDAAAPPDTAWVDAAMLVGSSSGPGILAFFKFQALQTGDSPVHCELVDFRDSQNVRTLPGCASGIVRVTGPVATRPASWGRLKIRYR